MSGHKWVPYNGVRTIAPGMIAAGRDADGATLVIGRASHAGDVLPAKAKPEHGVAYVAHGGREHMKTQFEVLMPTEFHWVASGQGRAPEGAVESGRTSSGETLYVGRGFVNGVPTVGKIQPSHGVLYVPYNGQEVALRDYEALVQK